MCRCCPSLLNFAYSYMDRLTHKPEFTGCHVTVLDNAKFGSGIFACAVCTRCGHELEDLEWLDREAFVSHCETINDPL